MMEVFRILIEVVWKHFLHGLGCFSSLSTLSLNNSVESRSQYRRECSREQGTILIKLKAE